VDAPFDEQADDYADAFTVYDLGDLGPESFPDDWIAVPSRARSVLGAVRLGSDAFDDGRRAAVRRSCLEI